MPPAAVEGRAAQREYIAVLIHQKSTDPEFTSVVDQLYAELDKLSSDDQVNVREVKRQLDIERKLPEEFVREMSQACSVGYSVWQKSRPRNDWESVRCALEKIVELSRQKAELIGYKEHPYDALLDLYEPGMTTSVVKPLLLQLANELKKIVPAVAQRFSGISPLEGDFPEDAQKQLCLRVALDIGFDLEWGRIDASAHPFTTTIGPNDVRITNRFTRSSFIPALYGTIHETGHALYDIGLPKKWLGTPLGSPVSLGIHESQSRIWENIVGRSREFCIYLGRVLPEFFPNFTLAPDELWSYVNLVKPSLIRVDADEVTYSLHIVIRMLLEEQLILGELNVKDLPAAWDDLYEEYLGIRPKDYKDGVMQDVHWYSGSIGYFPTYALGNLYNAMMMESIQEAVPDVYKHIENGQFSSLLSWLRENVHSHGMRYNAQELIKITTGKELNPDSFLTYIKKKFKSDSVTNQ
jgi:carboxypeptidase Taq